MWKNGTENAYQIKTLNTKLDKSYNMGVLCLWNDL